VIFYDQQGIVRVLSDSDWIFNDTLSENDKKQLNIAIRKLKPNDVIDFNSIDVTCFNKIYISDTGEILISGYGGSGSVNLAFSGNYAKLILADIRHFIQERIDFRKKEAERCIDNVKALQETLDKIVAKHSTKTDPPPDIILPK